MRHIVSDDPSRFMIFYSLDKTKDHILMHVDADTESFDLKSSTPYKIEYIGANCESGSLNMTDE